MAKTIEQRLREAGYGHRQIPASTNTGKLESLELLRTHPHIRGWQSITRL
jgi:hypothetical protein